MFQKTVSFIRLGIVLEIVRNVECPFDIIDRLGGWITSGVGQTYGKGYDLNVLSKWMLKVDSNILNKIE